METPLHRDPPILVTGGTGFLGSHFIYRALQRDEELSLVAMVRGPSVDAARDRLKAALDSVATSYCEPFDGGVMARVQVVLGDITRPMLGLAREIIDVLSGRVVSIWHFAASLAFEDRNEAEIAAHNEAGTRHAVALAVAVRAPRFVYVSTAYTAGRSAGVIPEQLHTEVAEFNNHYERTKAAAEAIVVSECAASGTEFKILRPSIVIGPSTTKRSGGSDTGLYGFVRELRRMRKVLNGSDEQLTISGDPDLPLNLIPVDLVVGDMCGWLRDGFPPGEVFHLTHPAPLRLEESVRVACDVAGVRPFRVVRDYEPRSPIERLIGRRMEFYSSYFREPKVFARSVPLDARMTSDDLRGFLRQALLEGSGRTIDAVLQRGAFVARDGTRLSSFVGGVPAADATMVLVNAFGMPAEFLLTLARGFAGSHRVITWESRGVPAIAGPLSAGNAGLTAHATDLADLLDAQRVEGPVHLVGWCSGAHVAHRFARLFPERAASLTLLNGAYFIPGAQTTVFQENIRNVMPRIARSPEHAHLYFETLYGRTEGGEAREVNHLLDGVDPSLIHMTSLPFQSPESLYRYALMMNEYLRDGEEAHAGAVELPCLIVAGKRDRVAHHEGSERFASRCSNARLLVMDDGDHYGLFLDPAVASAVARFVESAA